MKEMLFLGAERWPHSLDDCNGAIHALIVDWLLESVVEEAGLIDAELLRRLMALEGVVLNAPVKCQASHRSGDRGRFWRAIPVNTVRIICRMPQPGRQV